MYFNFVIKTQYFKRGTDATPMKKRGVGIMEWAQMEYLCTLLCNKILDFNLVYIWKSIRYSKYDL